MKKMNTANQPNEGIRLKALRKRLDMTQRELAREFYVSPGAVALWENGNRLVPGPIRKLVEIYEKLIVPSGKTVTRK
jgi:transcriptional regulator with XRE-family HTH domain